MLSSVLGSTAAILAAVLAACWLHHAIHAIRITDFLLTMERMNREGAIVPDQEVHVFEEYMDRLPGGRWTWIVSATLAVAGILVTVTFVALDGHQTACAVVQGIAVILIVLCVLLAFPYERVRRSNQATAFECFESAVNAMPGFGA